MKILFTASTLSHIKNFHLPYILWLNAQGHTVHVAAGDGGICPEADAVLPLPLKKSITAPQNIAVAWSLHRLIQQEQYDLISCHTSLASFFTRLSVWGRRRPVIINTSHGYLFDQHTKWFKRTLLLCAEKCMAHRTDLLMVMNAQDAVIAQREHLSRGDAVKINGMGVNLEKFTSATPVQKQEIRTELGIPADALVLIYIAEFSARKNQLFFIRAMASLPHHVHLILLGDGNEFESCQSIAKADNLCDRIHFMGYQNNTLPYLHAADVAVSSSRYEGLPFNLMEAMAVGLPLLVSDVKGNQDLVTAGENGFTFPYDNQDAFLAHINALSSETIVRMGAKSQELVQPYGLAQVLTQIVPYYATFLPR